MWQNAPSFDPDIKSEATARLVTYKHIVHNLSMFRIYLMDFLKYIIQVQKCSVNFFNILKM